MYMHMYNSCTVQISIPLYLVPTDTVESHCLSLDCSLHWYPAQCTKVAETSKQGDTPSIYARPFNSTKLRTLKALTHGIYAINTLPH